MRRFASFVALVPLLVSIAAPLATACPCREDEARTSHACCGETVLRSATPDCCALVDAAAVPRLVLQPPSPPGVLVAPTASPALWRGDPLAASPRPRLRSASPPLTVLRV